MEIMQYEVRLCLSPKIRYKIKTEKCILFMVKKIFYG